MSGFHHSSSDWAIHHIEKNIYEVEGDLGPTNIDSFCSAITQLPQYCTLRLLDLEIDDGPSMAVLITALRMISPCTLMYAPRMLGHTLYKINAREITLVHPRSY